MRWIRSFPAVIPPHRAYVVDELPRLVNQDYDYSGLLDLHDDILLIEWDMAARRVDMDRFAAHAGDHPGRVLVAPHTLYHVLSGPVWGHRAVSETGQERWIDYGEPECDYFAFGMIYLPADLIRAFLAAPAPARGRSPFIPPENPYDDCRFVDQTFSMWHRWKLGRRAAVDWTVCPYHLHYDHSAMVGGNA